MRESNRNRIRRIVDKVAKKVWEVVCLTELRAEGERVALRG